MTCLACYKCASNSSQEPTQPGMQKLTGLYVLCVMQHEAQARVDASAADSTAVSGMPERSVWEKVRIDLVIAGNLLADSKNLRVFINRASKADHSKPEGLAELTGDFNPWQQ